MTNTKDENDAFDAIFKPDNDVAEVTTPEFVAEKVKPKMHKTNQIFKYGKYALVLLVLMLVILFIIALALPSDNPSQTAQAPDIRIASQDVSRSTDKAADIEVLEEKSPNKDIGGVALENAELQEALQLAKKNTEFRDLKYQELLKKYQWLLGENDRLKNGISKKAPPISESRGLKTITGVSVYSVYNGYAFIKKGQTVYTVTLGENFAGGKVIAIDAINREVITTKGVIR